ncbi:23S rRNA (guanosine(2251)-2'-O)-methyltransferase RlmB [Azospirillum thermophilum]|uniref:23S rRNA (Guanosine(2251)-2'-O)-methyltransferase RlmB n=1 Tax=Azospirillum thermophilum TaxID=2202148 RepID=A0A2S2CQC4_9PROT|nr:23S rRNA (guanosine(2251)-2'-O)-methyltransferase RlmB [Azospirillum thermophilum]AWK86580.1 23S rRNA (guanosine(2251)-2'-O)-methyltransferase RlmB [Azospirillum thermophilum]
MTRPRKPAAPSNSPYAQSRPQPQHGHDQPPSSGRGGNRGERPRGAQGVLLYGLHPVTAAWLNPDRRIHRLLVTEAGRAAMEPVLAEARAKGLVRPMPSPADKPDLERMLPPGAVHQGVVLDTAPLPELGLEDVVAELEEEAPAVVVVLDQVTDPHNVGAILRSAAAFGAKAVVVTERHAPETTGVLAKSASGALEAVPLVRVTNLSRALGELQEAGFWSVGLAESGKSTLAQLDLSGRTALVLGAEGAGLRRLTMERCDMIARLPTGGPIGSLNVSNAAAVALYEVARLRG